MMALETASSVSFFNNKGIPRVFFPEKGEKATPSFYSAAEA